MNNISVWAEVENIHIDEIKARCSDGSFIYYSYKYDRDGRERLFGVVIYDATNKTATLFYPTNEKRQLPTRSDLEWAEVTDYARNQWARLSDLRQGLHSEDDSLAF